MKNTFIPLDIIFINKDGSINSIYKNTKPMSLKALKSKGKVLAVLEINAGDIEKIISEKNLLLIWIIL